MIGDVLTDQGTNKAPSFLSSAGALINVANYPGADLGAKLQAAHDALPAGGGILDARLLIGAQGIAATVTISKPCEILIGASTITCTTGATGAIKFVVGSKGAALRGCGIESLFQAAGGVTPILWIHGDDTATGGVGGSLPDITIEHVQVKYTSANAANIGILVDNFAERFIVNDCTVDGVGQAGYGIYIDASLIGVVSRNHVFEFDYGIYQNKSNPASTANPNANILRENVVNNCNEGLRYTLAFDGWLQGNTIQDNVTCDIRYVSGGSVMSSGGNHLESTATGKNVIIDGGTQYVFVGDYFSASANSRNIEMTGAAGGFAAYGCTLQNGITLSAGTGAVLKDCFRAGADSIAVGAHILIESLSAGTYNVLGLFGGTSNYTVNQWELITLNDILYVKTSTGRVGIGTSGPLVLFDIRKSVAGGTCFAALNNTSNTANSHARWQISVAGASAGDTFIEMTITGVWAWSFGLDNSDSDKFKIQAATAPFTTGILEIDVAGNTVWNEGGVDANYRIEGDNKPNNLLVEALDDEVSVDGRWSLRALTPAQLVADANNYDPESTASNRASTWRLSSDASRNITGIAAGILNGRFLYIVNVGANPIVLQNQNAGSADANKIITGTGADVTLAADGVAVLQYDSTTARWRILSTR